MGWNMICVDGEGQNRGGHNWKYTGCFGGGVELGIREVAKGKRGCSKKTEKGNRDFLEVHFSSPESQDCYGFTSFLGKLYCDFLHFL